MNLSLLTEMFSLVTKAGFLLLTTTLSLLDHAGAGPLTALSYPGLNSFAPVFRGSGVPLFSGSAWSNSSADAVLAQTKFTGPLDTVAGAVLYHFGRRSSSLPEPLGSSEVTMAALGACVPCSVLGQATMTTVTGAVARLVVLSAFAAPAGLRQVGGSAIARLPMLAPILAQATLDEPLRRFLEFITKVLLLIGLALVVFSGWLIGQGKTDNAVLCIVGGFVIAAAVPIMRMLAEMTGTTF